MVGGECRIGVRLAERAGDGAANFGMFIKQRWGQCSGRVDFRTRNRGGNRAAGGCSFKTTSKLPSRGPHFGASPVLLKEEQRIEIGPRENTDGQECDRRGEAEEIAAEMSGIGDVVTAAKEACKLAEDVDGDVERDEPQGRNVINADQEEEEEDSDRGSREEG